MEVNCDVDYTTLENEDGYDVDGIVLICTRCRHETESYGVSGRSVRRCLALMREECPRGEGNFYTTKEVVDD